MEKTIKLISKLEKEMNELKNIGGDVHDHEATISYLKSGIVPVCDKTLSNYKLLKKSVKSFDDLYRTYITDETPIKVGDTVLLHNGCNGIVDDITDDYKVHCKEWYKDEYYHIMNIKQVNGNYFEPSTFKI